MAKTSFEFDIRAWVRDPKLRECSPEARLLWLYLLFFMYTNSKAYGYLPESCTAEVLAERVDWSHLIEEVEGMSWYAILLAELELNAVFSRTPEGTVYCRRMVGSASDKATQILDKAFEDLVDQHPNATNVNIARALWDTLCKDGAITTQNVHEVLEGLDRWKASRLWHEDDGKYITGLDKWLANKRWQDRPKADQAHALTKPRFSSSGRDPYAVFVPKTKPN